MKQSQINNYDFYNYGKSILHIDYVFSFDDKFFQNIYTKMSKQLIDMHVVTYICSYINLWPEVSWALMEIKGLNVFLCYDIM